MRLEFETPISFQGKSVPEGTQLAGWAALVQALGIQAPVRRPSCVSEKHIRGSQREKGYWRIFDKRYQPGDQFTDHPTFALRHETMDLLLLKRAFNAVPKAALENYVRRVSRSKANARLVAGWNGGPGGSPGRKKRTHYRRNRSSSQRAHRRHTVCLSRPASAARLSTAFQKRSIIFAGMMKR